MNFRFKFEARFLLLATILIKICQDYIENFKIVQKRLKVSFYLKKFEKDNKIWLFQLYPTFSIIFNFFDLLIDIRVIFLYLIIDIKVIFFDLLIKIGRFKSKMFRFWHHLLIRIRFRCRIWNRTEIDVSIRWLGIWNVNDSISKP